jgi:hypothetical protein
MKGKEFIIIMRENTKNELKKLLILLLSIAGITIISLVVMYFVLNPLPCDTGDGG